ncbi:oocyst wall protein 4 [Cryptosporidium ubiquitum]|uniref:Oocyst wall protein 4 n=1 Tax=Cryptosporidium ubiquitum TaxID=857276 RepID=A0A1J4MIB8_9CRYT|nr:oocyst wall protein 4 [Cryptosporidium ubiquitum]OII73767.1 oocyst wall protein 4 [Cryptosporidium ubiquitum]
MYWIRWFIFLLTIYSSSINVETKPGISASHGKILISSANNQNDHNQIPSASNGINGRTFVHDKGLHVQPRIEPPVSPKLLCPKGYDLVDGNCLFSHIIPANIDCPDGFEVFKTNLSIECIKKNLVSAQLNCKNGASPKIFDNNAYCPTEIIENPSINCPSGTIQKDNECIVIESKPPTLKCSDGYSLDNDSNCKQVIESKPLLNCPPNTILEQTTMTCVTKVIVEPLEVCPPGAVPVKSRDLTDIKGLLNRITRNQDDKLRYLQEIPTLGSLDRYNNNNPSPGKTVSTNNLETQNKFFNNMNEQNYKNLENDGLNSKDKIINSGLGHTNDQIKSPSNISNQEKKSFNSGSNVYVSNIQEQLSEYKKPIGSNVAQADTFYQALYDSSRDLKNSGGIINESLIGDEVICLILQFTNPKVECPPGLSLTKEGICVHSDIFTPKKTCEGGIEPDSDNMCVIEKLLPAEVECPKGYTLEIVTGMCIKKEIEELVCPEGTILNKTSLKCESEPSCPEGFTLNNSTVTCENEKSEPPHQKCPEGTEYDESSSSCKVKDAQLPLIMCPEGYEQRGDDCVLDKRIPASYYCPSDYYQTNKNDCVKWYQDYLLQCPPFLELKEEVFAYRTDLIPPPAAGRGPVLPYMALGRNLQQISYENLDEFSEQRNMEFKRNVNRNGFGDHTNIGDGNHRKRYDYLSSTTPIVIKSSKVRGMVCFGWGKRYKMIVNCPEGTTLLNEKCIETRIMPPQFFCTKGYTFNEIDSTCLYEEKINPNIECPAYMNLMINKTGAPVCIGNRREPAEVSCPEGFEWLADTLNCQSQEFAQPRITCIKGYSIVKESTGTFCKRSDSIKPTPSCPPEYRYDNSNQICIYEVKLHEVRERDENLRNSITNIRTNLNL